MKKILFTAITGIFCVMLVVGCGSKEKRNIVGASGSSSSVASTSSAATVLTTDAMDALKAVGSSKTASSSGPSGVKTSVIGLNNAVKLVPTQFRSESTWVKPQKDADGYYIMKYTDSEDGTVFDVKVKPTPDYWGAWDGNKMPWDSLADGAEFTTTIDVKGSFDGKDNSGTFVSAEKEIRKVKTYTKPNPYYGVYPGQPEMWTWKGLDWNNTTRTRESSGTITKKSDGSWVKMNSVGKSINTDTAVWETNTPGTMTMAETETMTFTLSSGYSGVFNMKVAGTIYHTPDWSTQQQNVSGQIDGVVSLSGIEMVKLHLEGKGKENGDGPDNTSIVGYYTKKDDGFVEKTALTKEQIESIMKMAFGMGGGKH